MNCKICSPPGPSICPKCEAEIKVYVEDFTRRFQRVRRFVAGIDGRELMRREEIKCGG